MEQADNLADLHLLVQVIDAGGLAAAAQTLGTTRSLVSRRLLALEARLGAKLLNRNTRGLSVTATGEEVYRHAVLMCEAAQAALHAAGSGRRSMVVTPGSPVRGRRLVTTTATPSGGSRGAT